MYVRVLLLFGLSLIVACTDDTATDGCTTSAQCGTEQTCQAGACVPQASEDAGGLDSGADAGVTTTDAGAVEDARVDAGTVPDAGTTIPDAGTPDAGHAPVRLTFPPRGSVTSADRIVVRGVADPGTSFTDVRINGVVASSADGFATFSAEVPLPLGDVALDVQADSAVYRLGEVERQDVLLLAPRDMHRRARDLFVVDSGFRRLVRHDLDTGARVVVSGEGVGSGPSFEDPRGVVTTADGATAYVVDTTRATVFSVDVATGARTVLSSDAVGGGPTLSAPRRLVLDGGRLLLVDSGIDAVIAVDVATGARTVLSDDDTGMGPPFSSPRDIALDTARSRLLVTDSAASALFAVDLSTGDRDVLQGPGPFFATPRGVEVAADGSAAFVADGDLSSLFAVDLTSGERTIVSDGLGSADGPWVDPRRVALGDNGALLVLDYITDAIVSVDPSSGDRTVVAQSAAGAGPHLGGPWGVAIDTSRPGAPAIVGDNFYEKVYEVDFTFAQRRVVSELINPGPNLDQPYGMAWDEAGGRALVVDAVLDALLAVNVSNGARTLLSNDVTGAGTAFNAPRDVAVASDGRIFVVDSGADAVFEVDPATGDRTVRSDDATGTGTAFDAPWAVLATGPGEVVVADAGRATLVRVDLGSGNRTDIDAGLPLVAPKGLALRPEGGVFVSDELARKVFWVAGTTGGEVAGDAVGRGPPLSQPGEIDHHPDGFLVLVDANDAVYAVDPATGDRVFASK